ncbi:hypothetical protein FOZ61_005293 [Perkinsus olseni]|uniref:Uncharacterized protein n=1 Tax=Perkinsus olseni TaxID=32597 RepID=A0A7J6KZH9_PEROL|nr:hypothetical protein FOL46_009510 [Perkinsus olseni]KAF4658743.1 hypothetical protein FOZ61_005293 [Perkinsus olseni]
MPSTTISFATEKRGSSWLPLKLLFLVYVVHVVTAIDQDLEVTIDHPQGCAYGPDREESRDTVHMLDFSCISVWRGMNSDGVNQTSEGMNLVSNYPLTRYKVMTLRVNYLDRIGTAESPNITVETTGSAYLFLRYGQGLYVKWFLNPTDHISNKQDNLGSVSIDLQSRVYLDTPQTNTSFLDTQGSATPIGMGLVDYAVVATAIAQVNMPTSPAGTLWPYSRSPIRFFYNL